jgi:hypothetical protein
MQHWANCTVCCASCVLLFQQPANIGFSTVMLDCGRFVCLFLIQQPLDKQLRTFFLCCPAASLGGVMFGWRQNGRSTAKLVRRDVCWTVRSRSVAVDNMQWNLANRAVHDAFKVCSVLLPGSQDPSKSVLLHDAVLAMHHIDSSKCCVFGVDFILSPCSLFLLHCNRTDCCCIASLALALLLPAAVAALQAAVAALQALLNTRTHHNH